MIYLQHGPSWKPKADELLEKNLIQGIIWDPREETIDRITKVKNENQKYNMVTNLIDLKWFYKQFPNSLMKKLENLDYFPTNIIDRNYLRDTEEITNKIKKMINFEEMMNVDILMAPTLYMSSFNERVVDRLFNLLDIFYEETNEIKKDKYISLVIHEAAFDTDMYMKEFIDDISNYIGKYAGIYIVIDRDNTSTIRHNFSETRLAKALKFIYSMKKMQFKIIMGYCGIESINYMAIGADVISTGWFYSLRRFNRLEKGLEEYSSMGRAKKRYLSLNLLSELKIDEDIQMIPKIQQETLYKLILNGNDIDKKIINETYEVIPMNDTFIQYFEAMNTLSKKFNDEKETDKNLDKLEKMIENAIKNIDLYNEHRIGVPNITKKHLVEYSNAVKIFREENFI